MPNPAGYTFWLKDRQVTGVIIAEYGGETLVEYAKRLYAVKGKDPGKKHYTQSSIPAFWKKVMNGEAPPPPREKKAKSSKAAPPPVAPKKETPPFPTEAAASAPRKSRTPKAKPAPTEVASPVAARPAAKRKVAPVPPLKSENVAFFDCPECGQPQGVDASTVKVGKAFIRSCVKCGKEFAVRLIPVTTYRAEVAAFK